MEQDMKKGRTAGAANSVIYFFGALGGILFGYDTGIISGAILFIRSELRLDALAQGVVVSAILVGAMLGAVISGMLSDRFGRRRIILLAALIFCAGSLGSALSVSAGELILFRIVLGVAVGCSSTLVPMYLSEISPPEHRGALSSLNQLMITIGILTAYLVNFAFAETASGWRWMLGCAVIPAVLLLVGMLFLPESPRFLVKAGRENEARAILTKLRGKSDVEREINQMKNASVQNRGGFRALTSSWARPALVIGVGLAFFQQTIGCNTVIYYTPTTIAATGLGNSASIFAALAIGVLNVLVTVASMAVIDRIGRRKLLILGNIGMSASLVILWLLRLFSGGAAMNAILTVSLLGIYILFFGVSWGPVVWVMIGEIFPLNLRGIGMGIASSVNWLSNLLVTLTFPLLLEKMGTNLFLVYAGMGLLAILFIHRSVIETSGKSLEQIELELHMRSSGSEAGKKDNL